jgi:hypothetical protein
MMKRAMIAPQFTPKAMFIGVFHSVGKRLKVMTQNTQIAVG